MGIIKVLTLQVQKKSTKGLEQLHKEMGSQTNFECSRRTKRAASPVANPKIAAIFKMQIENGETPRRYRGFEILQTRMGRSHRICAGGKMISPMSEMLVMYRREGGKAFRGVELSCSPYTRSTQSPLGVYFHTWYGESS